MYEQAKAVHRSPTEIGGATARLADLMAAARLVVRDQVACLKLVFSHSVAETELRRIFDNRRSGASSA
jgi:hypothetical protein